jgi:hypothetical protein
VEAKHKLTADNDNIMLELIPDVFYNVFINTKDPTRGLVMDQTHLKTAKGIDNLQMLAFFYHSERHQRFVPVWCCLTKVLDGQVFKSIWKSVFECLGYPACVDAGQANYAGITVDFLKIAMSSCMDVLKDLLDSQWNVEEVFRGCKIHFKKSIDRQSIVSTAGRSTPKKLTKTSKSISPTAVNANKAYAAFAEASRIQQRAVANLGSMIRMSEEDQKTALNDLHVKGKLLWDAVKASGNYSDEFLKWWEPVVSTVITPSIHTSFAYDTSNAAESQWKKVKYDDVEFDSKKAHTHTEHLEAYS